MKRSSSTSSLQTAALLLAVSLQLVNGDGCPKGVYSEVPCVYKCCDTTEFSFDNLKCIGEKIQPGTFKMPRYVANNGTIKYANPNELYYVYDIELTCFGNTDFYLMTPLLTSADNFHVSDTGSLLNDEDTEIAAPGQFCINNSRNMGFIVMVCVRPQGTYQNNDIKFKLMN